MENKFVFREETFTDVAVRELAKTHAKCILALQYGRCNKKQCAKCKQHALFKDCVDHMSSYDKARLNDNVEEFYCIYSKSPTAFMSLKRFDRYHIKWGLLSVLGMLIVFAMLMGFSCCKVYLPDPQGDPHGHYNRSEVITRSSKVSDYTAEDIKAVLRIIDCNRKDITGDGVFNCMDRAILFCFIWNKYVDRSCRLVRNYNKDVMNHLFPVIYDYHNAGYVEVEPDTDNFNVFTMQECWGKSYVPLCNMYGDTEYWLSRCSEKVILLKEHR